MKATSQNKTAMSDPICSMVTTTKRRPAKAMLSGSFTANKTGSSLSLPRCDNNQIRIIQYVSKKPEIITDMLDARTGSSAISAYKMKDIIAKAVAYCNEKIRA